MTENLISDIATTFIKFFYIVKDTFEAQRQKEQFRMCKAFLDGNEGLHQSIESLASVRESTFTPLDMSSGDEYSSGLWLYPL